MTAPAQPRTKHRRKPAADARRAGSLGANDGEREQHGVPVLPGKDAENKVKASYVFKRWTMQRDHYSGLYKLWTRAILFLLGKHWLEWNKEARRWTPEQNVPRWRQRPVTNLVFAVYRSAIAKLTKQRPTFDVVPPRTGDNDDREAAHLGEALLQQLWRQLAIPKLLAKAVGWLLCAGNVSLSVHWDPNAGKLISLTVPVDHPETGEEVDCACDENGEPLLVDDGTGVLIPDLEAEPDQVFEGELAVELVDPTCVRYNPEAKAKEEATEYFIGYLLPAAVCLEKWELEEDDLELGTDDELEEVDDLIANAAGATEMLGVTSLAGDQQSAIGARALVIEYYRKPDDEFKAGRHWIQVNKTIVVDEEPLPEGFWPPIIDIDDVPVPGSPHALGLIGQVAPLNREYNTLNGKIAEHNVMMAMGGKWVVHPIDKNLKITTDPGQKLESKGYAEGKPPVQADIKTLPEGVYRERERILQDLQLVASMNDVGLGQKPEGVSSGRGFLVLQEATDAVLTPTLMNIELALQELGRRMLVIARRHYREERILKVRGHNGRWEIRSFMGADLGDSIDVQVQIGSSFPWSKSARQDLALSVIQGIGPLLPPGTLDMAKVSKILDVGGIQAFEPESDPDEQEVLLEHAQFEEFNPDKGILSIPQLGFWQNHARHYDEHIRLLKSERSRFARWHPEAQAAFLDHVLQTRQVIQTQGASLATDAMGGLGPAGSGAVGGAPPAAGGAPPGAPAGGPVGITAPGAPPGPGQPPPTDVPGSGAMAGAAALQPADFAAAGQ
jgi:hypothetical protein